MIIVNLKGGLGNQMFQYATGRAIALKNNTELKLDISGYTDPRHLTAETPRTYDLAAFNIQENVASPQEISRLKYPFGLASKAWRFFCAKVLRQHFLDYHPEILHKRDYYLDGFWQSEKNFVEHRDLLLEEFSLKKGIDTSVIDSGSLAIHVRRGDYVSNAKTNSYHGTTSLEYYKKAYAFVAEKTASKKVYVFSDDTAWVREHFDFIDKEVIFVSDLGYSANEEIILMSTCDHAIIANSSFSWWGAWLNQNPDKLIVAPQQWLSDGDGAHHNIVPDSWIRL